MLMALPAARVTARAESLRQHFRIEPRLLPARGLALVRVREGCFGEHYHIGEIPLAEVAIDLVDTDGGRFAGGARVMSTSAEFAEAVAIIDAVLTHRLLGWRQAAELLQEGLEAVEQTDARRSEIRTRTAVDFSALGTGGDDDEA
jgi:phosphonate C-P lyase system protein PhnG